MRTFLAVVDRFGANGSNTFPLSGARVALLQDGRIFTYLPNTKTWVPNESVERDYFDHYPELQYKVIPSYLARFLQSAMRDMSPIVVRITLEEAGKSALQQVAASRTRQVRRDLARNKSQLVRWARANGVELPSAEHQQSEKVPTSLKSDDLAFLALVTGRTNIHKRRISRGTFRHYVKIEPDTYKVISPYVGKNLEKNSLGFYRKSLTKPKKQKTDAMWGQADRDID
ncbi:hypothetical protein [Pseudarthrobacter sp. N5]|uniref:hypothetical protein n=1 Tax=Pseudarthrobacter sp. N5 TaxID=3418416 RepID=UPI003CEF6255